MAGQLQQLINIKIWTDPNEPFRHHGVWDEDKYRLEPASTQNVIDNFENYVKFEGLQIKLTSNSTPVEQFYIVEIMVI